MANYVGQIYITLIGIAVVPLYVRYLGAETYGLIGFFAMLQTWFQLLDIGLRPTMARAAAHCNGGGTDPLELRRLLRVLEGIFVVIAIFGSVAIIAGSDAIAGRWLNVHRLAHTEVRQAIMLMALIVALRWVSELYRGAIAGFERLVWLSGFNMMIVTARFLLVFPLFIYVGTSASYYFEYQLAVALIELIGLVAKTYQLLPQLPVPEKVSWQFGPLRRNLKFSLGIAFTGAVWVFVTQTDKLLLSKILSLSDYAYFTLAVLVASGVMAASGPISGALLPRLTKLVAEKNEVEMLRLYGNATQLIGVIAVPVALMLALFPDQVLWAWTGNMEIVKKAGTALTLYALGNAVLAFGAFPYYLQFAKGDLKLHIIGNAIFVVVLVPAIVWAASTHGATGAGAVWLATNTASLLLWVPLVHRRFAKGLHVRWMFQDVLPSVFTTLGAVFLVKISWASPHERIGTALFLVAGGALLLVSAGAGSSFIRRVLGKEWQAHFRSKVAHENNQE